MALIVAVSLPPAKHWVDIGVYNRVGSQEERVQTRDMDTDAALALLTEVLGAEEIGVRAWLPTEQGRCTKCGQACCRYGPAGSPLCSACTAEPARAGEVRTLPVNVAGPAALTVSA
jgi:hypothetical protein